MTIKHVR